MRAFLLAIILLAFEWVHAGPPPLHHSCPAASDGWKSKLLIDVLAVGQGDSTFIRTPSGTTILIDGGNSGRGRSDVLPTLQKCFQVQSLDYVVLTHPHADHFGGLAEVLSTLPVNQAVYDPGDSDGRAFAKYAAAAKAAGHRMTPALGDSAIHNEGSVKFTIVAINGHVLGGKNVEVFDGDGKPLDKNSVSIALRIDYGDFHYFTGGDLSGGGNGTPDVETPVADVVGPVTVMKSDHHGSATANNAHLLAVLHPRQIIVSVGDGESNKRYHLPNSDTMARLMRLPFLLGVFQTARGEGRAPASELTKVHNANGDVVVLASPESYSINGEPYAIDHPGTRDASKDQKGR